MPSLAKLSLPVPQRVLARSALFRRLDAAARRPVVWISGPPGAGKTTLVASWLRARRRRCLWYDADAGDADLATFFFYLAQGVPVARGRRKPLPLFTPEYGASAATFARRFFRELCEAAPRPFALVLDDLHEVPAGSALHVVLPEALAEIPPGVCALLVSREEPPPSLARLRTNGVVDEITGDELRLTTAEAKAIARLRGGDLADPELARVNARVRGWAAGLVLVLEGRRRARAPPDAPCAATPQLVFDYFAGEVLDRADPDARRVLLETALLPRVTGAMAARLTGVDRAGEVLDRLARRGYFTTRNDEAEPSFEYHPLFREFLLARAPAALGQARLRQVARTGAALLRETGHLEAAVELLAGAEAWDELTEVLLDRAADLFRHGRWRTLAEWIGCLPREALDGRPWLLFWLGVSRAQASPAEGRRWLERAFELFRRAREATGAYRTLAAIVETYIYEWNELRPLDRWIAVFDELQQEGLAFPDDETESRACAAMLSALLVRQPHHPSRDAWASRAMRLLAQIPDPQARLRIGMNLLHHHCWLGHFPAAESLVRELRDVARARDVDPLTAIQWGSIETQSHWIAGRVELALRAVDEALETSHAAGIHVWDFMLYTVGINACLLASDLAGARRHLARVEATLPLDRPLHTSQYHQMAALLELHSGHLDAARDHARTAAAAADDADVVIPQSLTRLTLASALLARGDAGAGRAVLAEALAFALRSGSPFLEFCCLLCEALHGLRSGDAARALPSLRQAFALARENGFATNPWLGSEALAEACALALEHGVEPEWVREIVRRHRLAPPPDRGDVPGWPWHLEISTLGRFEIRRGGEPIRFGRKTQRRPLELLKLLVALGGRAAAEDLVADVLWSDADGDAARHALETTIYRTRKLLGSDEAIAVREGKIALDRRLCWVDAWAFERCAHDALVAPRRRSAAGALDPVHRAIELYRGPFLPGDDAAPQLTAYRVQLERLREACARAPGTTIGTSPPDAG